MSTSETVPLCPADAETVDFDPELDDMPDVMALNPYKRTRDSIYIFMFYGIACLASVLGLASALWGYGIVIVAPFDEYSKKQQRESYEKGFLGMQSIVVLLSINILFTILNLHLAREGKQEYIWVWNTLYDFLIWATLIAFSVLNMILALWDRRLCDGWNGIEYEEVYKRCDVQMFRLLVVQLVATGCGLLVAVIHFILLIARCATNSALQMRMRIVEEEQVLMILLERRKKLIKETRALQERVTEREVPVLSAEIVERVEGDLIDISDEERGDSEASDPPQG